MRFLLSLLASLSLALSPALAGITPGGSTPTGLTVYRTTSGTVTVPAWSTGAYFTLVGGGGGGGPGSPGTGGSGGGGGGQTVNQAFAKLTPGATLTVTIGAGGASATAGGTTTVSGALTPVPMAKGGGRGCNENTCDTGGASSGYYGGAGGNMTQGVGGWGNHTSAPTATQSVVPTDTQRLSSIILGAASGSGGLATDSGGNTPVGSNCPSLTSLIAGGAYASGRSGGSAGGCSFFGVGGAGGAGGSVTGGAASGYGGGGGAGGSPNGVGGAGSPGIAIIRFVP